MVFIHNIILVCWAIFFIYWIINWFNVKPTKEVIWGVARFRIIAVTVTIIIVLIVKIFRIKLGFISSCNQTWYDCPNLLFNSQLSSVVLQIIGVLLAISGLILAIVARYTLASNWSATIELKKGHELITNGIYSYIRHPIYTALLCMGLGTFLVSPSLPIVLVYVFIVVMVIFRIKKEEELMSRTFPNDYPLYKKKVKMLIPFIW